MNNSLSIDLETYKEMYEEVCKERDGWISEYQSAQSKLNEEQYQNTLLAQKCSDLADELEIYKDIDLQAVVKEQQQTIEDQNAEINNLKGKLTVYEEQWEPSKQEQIDSFSERFDQLDDEYQELVKFSTMIFRGIPRFELTALMSSDQFEKFKNHLGV